MMSLSSITARTNPIASTIVRTPAKLILSGEHAVLYGHPAIAMAVNLYTQVTVTQSCPLSASLHLNDLNFQERISLSTLKKIKNKIKRQYHQYQQGEISIRQVLKKPFELSLFTFANVLDYLKNQLSSGVKISTQSDIPIGCGMGSSAANIVSMIYALNTHLSLDLSLNDYFNLSLESENLQHGISSGLDIHTVYHGGCLYYQTGQFKKHPPLHLNMQLIHTGQPQTSTGECVAHTAIHFKKNPSLGQAFEETTQQLSEAIQHHNEPQIKNSIRKNHALLNQLGVVPDKVNALIQAIETQNGAAKICGAGSHSGDAAGVILAITDQDLTPLAAQQGYQITTIQMDTAGTHAVSS